MRSIRHRLVGVVAVVGAFVASTGAADPRVHVVRHVRVAPAASSTSVMSTNVSSAGDVNGDGRNDLLAFNPATDEVRLYRGTGAATFGYGRLATLITSDPEARIFPGGTYYSRPGFLAVVNSDSWLYGYGLDRAGDESCCGPVAPGWGLRFLDGHADFTGDGIADAVGVTSSGYGYLYRGRGDANASFTHGTRIASGWATMRVVFAATDVTGDRRADLLGVDSAGVLWIFPGTGKGTFTPKRKVGSGWGGLGALFSARDVTGDGRVDLGAITSTGTLRIYKGRGDGTFSSAVAVSSGWAPYL
ncbi:hypothetical protein GCM10025782_03610 [Pedococcus ginsenosidimutans]|uniref:VCBS repeat-containing protein n=1 Tax=Pedococcus ginsenosidimutans TaxID=490570 RepID=A0ABP8XP36_9MICO